MAYYNSQIETKVPLQSLITVNVRDKKDVQDILNNAGSFLRRELPIRIAHRAYELESSELFKRSKAITQVANYFKNSFAEIVDCPAPNDAESERLFADTLQGFLNQHSTTLIEMAHGAHDLRTALKQDATGFAEEAMVQNVLNSFYMSRIDIRTVGGAAVEPHLPLTSPSPLQAPVVESCVFVLL
jgi:hypothetical protein